MTDPIHELDTDRLVLRRTDAADPTAILAFFLRNVDHLDPWLPEARPIADDPAVGPMLMARSDAELAAGREERWYLFLRDAPDRCVGYVFLTRFRTDGHKSCELSFGIDRSLAGTGLMREAATRVLAHARALGFTRVDARYATDNAASGRLLDRLGFTRIGIAPQHAWIGGAWRDHVLVTHVQR